MNKNSAIINKFKHLINTSSNYDDYSNNISKNTTVVERGLLQEIFAYLYFIIFRDIYEAKDCFGYNICQDKAIDYCKKHNLPTTDHGIDMILVHTDNSVSLVQVKYRSNQYNTHGRDVYAKMTLDKESSTVNIKEYIIFSNTFDISVNAEVKKHSKFKTILYDTLREIDFDYLKINLDIVDSLVSHKNITVNKIDHPPRKWQIRALYFTMLEYFKGARSVLCSIACGAGKTFFSKMIIQISSIDEYFILIVVPSLQLLWQWLNVLCPHLSSEYLLVGSDCDGIDVIEDIFSIPINRTTDISTIRNKINNRKKRMVVISTYQSVEKVYDALKSTRNKFDLTICDEAHLTVSKEESVFRIPTLDTFPSNRMLYLTGTIKVSKNGGDRCMNNKGIYGNRVEYPLRTAIDDGILCDYNILLGLCTDIGNDFPMSKKYKLYSKFLLRVIREKGDELKKILITSNSHNNIKLFYDTFSKMYELEKRTNPSFDHKLILMPKKAKSSDKSKALREIDEGPAIIFQVRVFNLGTDIPSLQGVFFCDEKSSKIDILQTLCRCLRMDKNNPDKKGYIIVPAFYGEDLECDGFGDYQRIRKVLKTLGEKDEALCEELKEKSCGNRSLFHKDNERIKCFVSNGDVDMNDGDINYDEVSYRTFDRFGDDMYGFEKSVDIYKELVELNGKMPSQDSKDEKERKNGKWVNNQRMAYKKGKLDDEKIKSLEQLPLWVWNPLDASWKKQCDIYKELVEINNKIPSQSSKDEIERQNALWVSIQRKVYKKGKLDDEKIKRLEQLPLWVWSVSDAFWKEQCDICREYNKNGKIPSQHSKDEKEKQNAVWIQTQRRAYKKGEMLPERIVLLKELGII